MEGLNRFGNDMEKSSIYIVCFNLWRMEQETFYNGIRQENMYDLLCRAKVHFSLLPEDSASRERYAPSYSLVVSACRVLNGRKLTGMNVEQFRQNHSQWYGEVIRALTEVADNTGLL